LDTGRLIGRRVLLAEDNLINQVSVISCVTYTVDTVQMLDLRAASVWSCQQGSVLHCGEHMVLFSGRWKLSTNKGSLVSYMTAPVPVGCVHVLRLHPMSVTTI
jgi:hypothetical protein